jgi:sugar-specific transcriptional regulator TrmB
MSIQDLVNQGTEALKSMTIDELKTFLASHETASVQEAFILTNANINDEVDVLLRKTLGVLNDNKMEINQLVNEFKKYGKKLNRVLTKASKAKKVYNDNEIDNIKKLNKCLADLMVTIKASTDKSSIQVIKRLMKAFTSQAAVVGKIVEKKKKDLPKAEVKDTKKKAVQVSAAGTMRSLFDIIAD